jgi:hypothetical protein
MIKKSADTQRPVLREHLTPARPERTDMTGTPRDLGTATQELRQISIPEA